MNNMSRLFEKFMEELFGSNPHLHAEAQRYLQSSGRSSADIKKHNGTMPERNAIL